MITLIIIAYIVVSLIISFSNMRDRYNLFGEYYPAEKPKQAFKEGFLILPILFLVAGAFIGVVMFVGAALISVFTGGVWIYHNMP